MLFGPKLIIGFILWASEYKESNGHGRLIEPPSRASMWRYGFNTPPNYNDHELYCGGFTRQYQTNNGKCGICGDPWDAPQPRPNEAGGKYGQGVIVRRYKAGQPVIIRVELTANHRGYFEFRLCPNNAPKRVASQSCLDRHVLQRVRTASAASGKDADEAFHETRFYPGAENRVYEMRYSLPDGLTCSQCVLQWKYVAGNNWGVCANGTGAVGCGPQEEFRACADVSVTDRDGSADASPHPTQRAPGASTAAAPPADGGEDGANEIPTGDDAAAAAGDRDGGARPSGVAVALFVASAVLLSLATVAAVFAFVYWYYYRAGDTIKSWWRSVTDSSSYACVVRKRGDKRTAENEKTDQPVPPPRAKKTAATIGFKGVPDNLV